MNHSEKFKTFINLLRIIIQEEIQSQNEDHWVSYMPTKQRENPRKAILE